ncbi:MAG: hypothetical protein E5W45_04465 [Mesorhizobium sp.]|nr:MAG: hypothetical protein E5W45_04465 [Mesorhizobium sp.]
MRSDGLHPGQAILNLGDRPLLMALLRREPALLLGGHGGPKGIRLLGREGERTVDPLLGFGHLASEQS